VKSQPAAYSYIRFSTPAQAEGDSLRRQTDAAKSWCARHGVRLDTSLTFRDLGKSAFLGAHRKNPDRYALAAFLKLVQDGRVARGSYLVIESLDRLTREHVRAGLMLLLGLIESGVRIVQLSPSELVYDEKSDEMGLMLAIVELSRGHRESKRKSDLQSAAWVEKRRKARESGTLLTHKFPAWVEERGGRLYLIPERAAVVRRIFQLAAAGYGQRLTTVTLIRENVPSFVPAGHWSGSYIASILKDRRALGEFQPRRKRDRSPQGPPIPNYYPVVVTEAEWLAARAGAVQRRNKRGRTTNRVNVFAGLLKNARHGDSYFCSARSASNGRGSTRVLLINTAGQDGRVPSCSFPFDTFEKAMLSMLAEVDPCEVLGQDDGPDEVVVLSGELAGVEARIGELETELLNGDVAALAKVLRQLEVQKRDLADKLAEARIRSVKPLGDTWGEAQSLLAALASAPDPVDAKLRLRSALRRLIDEVWMLVVARGHDRLCAVQVFFAEGGTRRDYIILHCPARGNHKKMHEERWYVRSLKVAITPGDMDLRKREDAEALAKALESLDLKAVTTEPAKPAQKLTQPAGRARRKSA
jgi:DNA invertase Pin-like site-specific DNA recombinase